MNLFTNRYKIIIAVICVAVFIIWLMGGSKSQPKDKTVDGIYVSELLNIYALENSDVDYCDLLSDAVDEKRDAIRTLALLDIKGDAFYDHGCVVVDLIDKIGEETFITALGGLTWDEEKIISDCIITGLEYGNGKHQNQKLDEAFPKSTSIFSEPIKMKERPIKEKEKK